jgi:hypothetical protein
VASDGRGDTMYYKLVASVSSYNPYCTGPAFQILVRKRSLTQATDKVNTEHSDRACPTSQSPGVSLKAYQLFKLGLSSTSIN